jgi:hypothetical protein
MDTTTPMTIVGIFDDHEQAVRAVDALNNAGFHDDQIGFIRRSGETVEGATQINTNAHHGGAVGTGALIGGLVGAAAALLIPGVGPVLAGGVLINTFGATAAGAAVVGALGGAVVGGLVGGLTELGVPEDEARYADQEFQAGRTIVTVQAGERRNEAKAILANFGAYDVHTGRPGVTTTTLT